MGDTGWTKWVRGVKKMQTSKYKINKSWGLKNRRPITVVPSYIGYGEKEEGV